VYFLPIFFPLFFPLSRVHELLYLKTSKEEEVGKYSIIKPRIKKAAQRRWRRSRGAPPKSSARTRLDRAERRSERRGRGQRDGGDR
tara:strand:- start:729 stop:986 length:258 start_codon:yes stop_codon:yes gene_type:complete